MSWIDASVLSTLAAATILHGCARDRPVDIREPVRSSPDCGQSMPIGNPTDMETPVGASPSGIRVDGPVFCEHKKDPWSRGAYVRLHGNGFRQLVLRRDSVAQECRGKTNAAELGDCAEILADDFGKAVVVELRRIDAHKLGRYAGLGVGICGVGDGDYDDSNASVSAFNWRDADDAIRVIGRLMHEWQIANNFGLSLRGISCVHLNALQIRELDEEPIFGKDVHP